MAARYIALVTAALLQIALAMAIGMPAPRHPFDLWVAFTFVSFAFLGLGLVMAMMADNVPAVQALGQCIFLPMLIIGGVAVPLASLPDWAQHVSAFFPGPLRGRGAAGVGDGRRAWAPPASTCWRSCSSARRDAWPPAELFRWDAQQRFAARGGKAWLAVAFAGWAAVGLLAESRGAHRRGRLASRQPNRPRRRSPPPSAVECGRDSDAPPRDDAVSGQRSAGREHSPAANCTGGTAPSTAAPLPPRGNRQARSVSTRGGREAAGTPPATEPRTASPEKPAATEPRRACVMAGRHAGGHRTGPGLRSPAVGQGSRDADADADEEPDPEVVEELEFVREALPKWAPGKVADPVQRVRNYLYVAAVPDVFQIPIERFIAQVVYERLQEDVPKDQLIQILYWIALHPNGGDDAALDQMWALRLGNGPSDTEQVRERAAFYAVKLLGRLTGKIVPR